jgi:phosphomannomutase
LLIKKQIDIFLLSSKKKEKELSALMVSISGIRGIVGESLTPAVIEKFSLALGTFLKQGTVIVGGDSRTSGSAIRNIVKGCLQATGCQVVDVGIVPTPTVQMEILRQQAAGGVAITASHNPAEWNGLKFMDANGHFMSPAKAQAIYALAEEEKFDLKDWEHIGGEFTDSAANEMHIKAVLELPFIDIRSLRRRKFKIVVDCVNGAGGLIIPLLAEKLGCSVHVINGEANGRFAHIPEPLPENLNQLSAAVKTMQADVGFAVDPDVDRCALVDNTGHPIGEEYTLALAVKFLLGKKLGPVVVNMSTSRAAEDIAKYYNCPFFRSKVGEINVVEEMVARDAVIGGEGNGGVILPDVHLGRDALVAVALCLQHLLESGQSINDLVASLPQYQMVKSKIELGETNPDRIINKLIAQFPPEKINQLDGLKIDERDYWVHLRKSNTEPIIRIIAEARTKKEAEKIVAEYSKRIKTLF